MEKATALITGVTGMDGSHLADLLLGMNYHVIGLKRRTSTDNTWRISHLAGNPDFELVEGDITDYYCMSQLVDKYMPDKIFSTAAQSHVGTSFKQPQLTWDITGQGAMNTLQAAVDVSKRTRLYRPRLLQCSSSEMFGSNYSVRDCAHKGDNVLFQYPDCIKRVYEQKFQNEDTPFAPNSPYGIAKLAAHQYVRMCREAYDIFACSSICFNHSGERRTETFILRKVSKWIGEYVNGKNLDMRLKLGNLDAMRDFGYAPDYVKAMNMTIDNSEPEDFVICTGKSYTIEDAVRIAFEHVNLDYKYYIETDSSLIRDREVEFLQGDSSKIQKELGWKPTTTFEEMIKIMVDADIERAK